MRKTRIAVFVSGGGTNLEAILKEAEAGRIPHGEIALVLASKPGVYALERAKNHGIPSVAVSRKDDPDTFESRISEALAEYRIDMIVLAGFLSILSADFTDRWDGRIINVHPSLIPSFCGKGFYGLKVHEAALSYGVKVTGATVHFVNSVPDGGKIILQKAVYIEDGDTPEILQRRVMEQAEWEILPRAVELVAASLCGE
ncbi:MAG: phosphoribosylglycinamide formyltransferase [Ruminococcaceae bacterium]|jgi:phosphoribosylglycinamide formyltransferase-1|nr:phosphoribosylglycinamide formyltransferase [Oscillospiraceae bacterium]